MQILLSCAKTMANNSHVPVPYTTQPEFKEEATLLALQLAELDTASLEKILHVNRSIAIENQLRYQHFHDQEQISIPAILAYTGIVFKRINPNDFTYSDFQYAQEHLHITSFLYGLLKPLDCIRQYRLEGNAVLPQNQGKNIFAFWKEKLTDIFITYIKADDGILVNLASDEMKKLFNWQRICNEVHVITPEFRIYKDGKLKNIVVYTKMCRGEMTRYIIKQRLTDPEVLKQFTWEGFHWNETNKNKQNWYFTND